ncbi:MAG: SIMPL domain-containing protein [Bacteroidaceae bacterium]|nr:SIMPL domain-containing protein [Prevotellaceae bacterium]MDY2848647.1 SIMPL domain-containing protein [Bacteroidaceae bacterium]
MKLPHVSTNVKQAAIIALGIIALGFCVKAGLNSLAGKDRKVVVKGLAEREVEADKVTWPILSKEIGNDLPELYKSINATVGTIKQFLLDNGIKPTEISVNAPVVIDLNADRYSDNRQPYRYNVTSIITVTSNNVKLVRSIIARQGELLKKGVAIVDGGYENPVKYEFVSFKAMKPAMMQEAIENAELTATQFAKNSNSRLDKIMNADQGQFSIENRDSNTPYIKKVRVVTTVTYSLKD